MTQLSTVLPWRGMMTGWQFPAAAAGAAAAAAPDSAASGSSPGLPITHTFSSTGTSSPSSNSTFNRVPAVSASHSKAALSVS